MAGSVRRDPIRRITVIVAEERVRRPGGWSLPDEPLELSPCPFCPGNERLTPPEVLGFRPAGHKNDPNWSVRVVPNQLPALRVEGTLEREAVGFYDHTSAVGAHEVIVESPAHVRTLDELGPAPITAVAEAWQERLVDLQRDFRLRYPAIFQNVGRAAGAQLLHAHSQLIALPFVPPEVLGELAAFRAHHDAHERCLQCDLLRQEAAAVERVVFENSAFVVLAPYASRVPFELWIVPRRCEARFERMEPRERTAYGEAVFAALRKVNGALGKPALRLVLRTAPFGPPAALPYHFRLELLPVLAPVGGFELGTGVVVNPIAPEAAAEILRDMPVGT